MLAAVRATSQAYMHKRDSPRKDQPGVYSVALRLGFRQEAGWLVMVSQDIYLATLVELAYWLADKEDWYREPWCAPRR